MSYTSNFTGAQIDTAIDKVLNGGNVKTVTIWVPSKETFMMDSIDSTLLEKNRESFQLLKNQTEPMLIFLQELGDVKPYAQVAMRMRHLDAQGEGTSFFAFGYYVPYTSEDKYGLLAYSDDMFKLYEDGHIKMITLLGDERNDYFDMCETSSHLNNYLTANYTQHYSSSNGATVPSSSTVEVMLNPNGYYIDSYLGSDNRGKYHVVINNLLGAGTDVNFDMLADYSNNNQPPVEFIEYNDKKQISSFTLDTANYSHSAFGTLGVDLTFDVDYSEGTWPVIRLRGPVTLGGWANIDSYELRFDSRA
jgi:hypothetical protein